MGLAVAPAAPNDRGEVGKGLRLVVPRISGGAPRNDESLSGLNLDVNPRTAPSSTSCVPALDCAALGPRPTDPTPRLSVSREPVMNLDGRIQSRDESDVGFGGWIGGQCLSVWEGDGHPHRWEGFGLRSGVILSAT